jgi:hypothetical protein
MLPTTLTAIGLSMLLQGSGLAQVAPARPDELAKFVIELEQVAPDEPPCFENATGPQCPFEPGSHKTQPKEIPPNTKPYRASGRKDSNPDMEGREGVPPSAGSGSRAVASTKRWCKWGEDAKTTGCDNLGSGVGG